MAYILLQATLETGNQKNFGFSVCFLTFLIATVERKMVLVQDVTNPNFPVTIPQVVHTVKDSSNDGFSTSDGGLNAVVPKTVSGNEYQLGTGNHVSVSGDLGSRGSTSMIPFGSNITYDLQGGAIKQFGAKAIAKDIWHGGDRGAAKGKEWGEWVGDWAELGDMAGNVGSAIGRAGGSVKHFFQKLSPLGWANFSEGLDRAAMSLQSRYQDGDHQLAALPSSGTVAVVTPVQRGKRPDAPGGSGSTYTTPSKARRSDATHMDTETALQRVSRSRGRSSSSSDMEVEFVPPPPRTRRLVPLLKDASGRQYVPATYGHRGLKRMLRDRRRAQRKWRKYNY